MERKGMTTAKNLKVRSGIIKRDTTETQIALKLVVDGQGVYNVSTGIRFFDHML
jgi:imidazoleglycerol-phosphate dehydratase